MSMIGNLLRVSKEELELFLNNSSLLEERLYSESEEEDPFALDIDKAWDGILYLLTGKGMNNVDLSALPSLECIFFNDQIIDEDQDLGYGPAFYITSEQTQIMNGLLVRETRESLLLKYRPEKMSDIYPDIWDEGEEAFDYLYQHFEELQQFYLKAAAENQAVIFILN